MHHNLPQPVEGPGSLHRSRPSLVVAAYLQEPLQALHLGKERLGEGLEGLHCHQGRHLSVVR